MNDNQNNKKNQNNKNKKNVNGLVMLLVWAVVLTVVFNLLSAYTQEANRAATTHEILYSEFIDLVEQDKIQKVIFSQDGTLEITPVEGFTYTDETGKTYDKNFTLFTMQIGGTYDHDFLQRLKDHGVEYTNPYVPEMSPILEFMLTYILPTVLMVGIFMLFMNMMAKRTGGMGGMGGVGKSNAKVYMEKSTGVTFADVAGQDEAKESLEEIIDFLHNPGKYTAIGAKLPRGALLVGSPGTGKTLLTLAAGLTQTMEQRRFNEIIITRATISVGEDIGFLPGTEEEKMAPWLGAIDDNLEVLNRGSGNGSDWGRRASEDLIRSRIRIKSMSFMRGRTFLNKFVIIDEAQNLTPKQMKTLITRAGPGTKIVCLGNIAQIDTPYLTEGSSGLTYVVDRFKGWPHSGHITMQRGERSRLADFASDAL